MLNLIFINFCIMVAVAALTYHSYSAKQDFFIQHTRTAKILLGMVNGLMGYLLMVNGIHVTPAVIVDFRNFAVVVSGIWGGPLSALITATIIGVTRVYFWGASEGSAVAVITIFVIGFGSSLIAYKVLDFKSKWIGCTAFNILIGIASLSYLLHDKPNYYQIGAIFIIGSVLIAVFLYKLIDFYIEFHENNLRLSKESTVDFLTGLNNVRGFDIEYNKSINRCSRKGEHLSFLLIDIDFFKKVNDTHGHASGDLLLKKFANLLVDTCRSFDIISRNGGEEFTVILQDCPAPLAVEVAERIRHTIEETGFMIHRSTLIRITASVGVSSFPEHASSPELLVELADKALYHAKRSGRNQVILHESIPSTQNNNSIV